MPAAFAFTYDNLNQMQNSDFANVTGSAGSYGLAILNSYKENIGSYDKNGNILSQIRKGKTGNDIADFSYDYAVNSNKLAQVATGADNLSYQYNTIGQMTQQTEGSSIMKLKYNAYGLVTEIRNGNDKLLLIYKYDDLGNRYLKTNYDPNVAENPAIKNVFYVHDASGNVLATYEQTLPAAPALVELPIYGTGRIGIYKPQAATVFYEVNDHLGNVRAVIGVPKTEPFYTDFETVSDADFQNYSRQDDDLMDHTDAGGVYVHSQLLNGGYSGRIGLAKSLEVSPGDHIKVEAYGKYRNLGTGDNLDGFAAAPRIG